MPDSDYTTTPPGASAVALAAISEKISDIREEQKKLSEIPGMLTRMNMQLEQLNKEHQQTRLDLQQTRTNFTDEISGIKTEVRTLQDSKTTLDTFTGIVKWGGISLIAAIAAAWLGMSARVQSTDMRSQSNTQRIEMVERDQKDYLSTINDVKSENRALQLEFYKRGAKP